MKNYIIALLSSLLAAVSCSKVIEIDYEVIDPMYVVEATISADGGTLLLAKTSAMDEPAQSDPITSATVSVESSRGETIDFQIDDEGYYQTTDQLSLTAGDDYTLTVEVDEKIFTSTSRLYAEPQIDDISFSLQAFTADMDLIFCTFKIQDPAGEANYFRYRFRYFANDNEESGEPSWSLAKETSDGDPIEIMTHLYTMDRDLEDGDVITIEVQAIDKATYDYLYTLSLSGSSSSNPTSNFEGGCLGYFSAYSLSIETATFYYDLVVD